jgi:hypothetical protein
MGKFDSKFTQVLYDIVLNGGADESFSPYHDGYVDVYDLILTSNRGHIIHNDNNGHVDLVFTGSRKEARSQFSAIMEACEEEALQGGFLPLDW